MKIEQKAFQKSLLSSLIFTSTISLPALAHASDASIATESTIQANNLVLSKLPFENTEDFSDANRGKIADFPSDVIESESGRISWNPEAFDFINQETQPDSVNPSLWRMANLNQATGLFKVTDNVYQIRGADLANITIIEGESGIIVIDALMSKENARAAMELYFEHRPERHISALIYTHNHVDHFGGSRGLFTDGLLTEDTQVIAPDGFMETLVKENIIAGPAMNRRIQYQFGTSLETGLRGRVDGGLGQSISTGNVTLIPPTLEITGHRQKLDIDGVNIEFLLTPNAEAPAEMVMYFPDLKVLASAEMTSPLLHNLYAIRGAAVRNGSLWSGYINEIMHTFNEADILVSQHHWPKWGNDEINSFLEKQRDIYKFIHDQSVRLMNRGYTPSEISESIQLPNSLENEWGVRGYYGTVSHNAKAQYQLYLGWYDGHPANLNPLPRNEAARHFVEYMDGEDTILEKAQEDFDDGEYRWVAQVLSYIIYANPENEEARTLQARAFEQLGYQSESAIWRNAYLQGAEELRHGNNSSSGASIVSPDLISAMSTSMYFDYLGVNLDPELAEGKDIEINWHFTDAEENYLVNLTNSTLTHIQGFESESPDVEISISKETLNQIILGNSTYKEGIKDLEITLEGNSETFFEFIRMFDTPAPSFNIIEPIQILE